MNLTNPQWAGKCRVDAVSWAEGTGHGLAALADAAPELADGHVVTVEPERPVAGESELHFVKLGERIQAVCRRHSAAGVAAVVRGQLPKTHQVQVVTRRLETCVVWGSPKGVSKFVAETTPYAGPMALEPCPACAAIGAQVRVEARDFDVSDEEDDG